MFARKKKISSSKNIKALVFFAYNLADQIDLKLKLQSL